MPTILMTAYPISSLLSPPYRLNVARSLVLFLTLGSILMLSVDIFAHNVARGDQNFLETNSGIHFFPYLYLGAKHMVTGYDHILYLAGVIFFLYRVRDVAVYVSLFAIGHSITLLAGVLGGWHVNVYIVDAIIGLSIVYKAFENIGGFNTFFPRWLDTRAAVLLFGLIHGLGLATKLQDLSISQDGLVVNMIAFNLGVELGQLLALTFLVLLFSVLRNFQQFQKNAVAANVLLMCAGFILFGYQLAGYYAS